MGNAAARDMRDDAPAEESVTLDEILAESVRVYEAGATESMRRADRGMALEHAVRNPRVLSVCLRRLTEFVTHNAAAAAACIYSLPRGGKRVTGPSVRFAEMVVAAWGSLDVKTTIVSIGDDAVVISGRAHDLEVNSVVELDTRRLVQKKRDAVKADEDMKQLAVSSGTSIAYRNAVLRIVPRALLEDALEAARKASTGKGTLTEKRQAAFALFAEMGATGEQVLASIGKAGVADVTLDDLVYLRGLVTSIRTGAITLTDAMRPQEEREATRRRGVTVKPSNVGAPAEPKTETPPPARDREPGEDDDDPTT
jgi:hypothetical protein